MRAVTFNGYTIEYDLKIKRVKNINMRINAEGEVFVSANKNVPIDVIEGFILSKAERIMKIREESKKRKSEIEIEYFTEKELRDVILKLCDEIYPHFEKRGFEYPQVKFRRMKSCWGSCNYVKGNLTFNTNLVYAPIECIEYVVVHEFCHLLVHNHSKEFYNEVEKICPDWKIRREKLKKIKIKKELQ